MKILLAFALSVVILLAGCSQDKLFFQKEYGYGECYGENCSQLITLHESGKIAFVGMKNQDIWISREKIEDIKRQIRSSGIMDKDCLPPYIVADYVASYQISLDGQIKSVNYPGCKEELDKIEAMLPLQ